jgi:hypothetical protein
VRPSLEDYESKFDGISGYLSDMGNTDEMAQNALKILKMKLFCKI